MKLTEDDPIEKPKRNPSLKRIGGWDTSDHKCYSCGEPTTINFWCDFCHDYMTPCNCDCHNDSEFSLIQDDCDHCWTKHEKENKK